MTLKVGINGFGRIGRMILRSIIEQNRKDLEVVAINNRSDAETSSFLLINDTIHGKLKSKISHSEKTINIDGEKINMIQENEISKIDWKKCSI
jgi:glyceraldehyde 3-phosphate dehydrogenase